MPVPIKKPHYSIVCLGHGPRPLKFIKAAQDRPNEKMLGIDLGGIRWGDSLKEAKKGSYGISQKKPENIEEMQGDAVEKLRHLASHSVPEIWADQFFQQILQTGRTKPLFSHIRRVLKRGGKIKFVQTFNYEKSMVKLLEAEGFSVNVKPLKMEEIKYPILSATGQDILAGLVEADKMVLRSMHGQKERAAAFNQTFGAKLVKLAEMLKTGQINHQEYEQLKLAFEKTKFPIKHYAVEITATLHPIPLHGEKDPNYGK